MKENTYHTLIFCVALVWDGPPQNGKKSRPTFVINYCYVSLCNSRYCSHVLLYPLTYILFTIVSYPLLWMIWRSYPQWVQVPNEHFNSAGFFNRKPGYCSIMTDTWHLSLLGNYRRFLITSLTVTCGILYYQRILPLFPDLFQVCVLIVNHF